jgi:diguanylate cyclase (GGDEF)-like protein
MQVVKLHPIFLKLGFAKTIIVLTAITICVSVFVTIIVMYIDGLMNLHGIVIATLVPLIVVPLTSLSFMKKVFSLAAAESELEKLAITDDLTGIFNRRYFLDVAEREIARALRFGKPFAAILLDIDGFKKINDSHGHGAGDAVLSTLASICQRHCRKIDTFARYGGDEFYFLLPECTREEAQTFAERIRSAIEQIRIDYEGHSIPVTVSLGVQSFAGPEDSLDRLLIRTDNAMYAAKQSGKNTVSTDAVQGK